MFVQLTTTEGRNVAVNPLAIALIMERDPSSTAIETTDGNEYCVAESFLDVKLKLESAINERYRKQNKH